MQLRDLRGLFVFLTSATLACGGSEPPPPVTSPEETPAAAPAQTLFVTSLQERDEQQEALPALFFSSAGDAPAVGFIREAVLVEPTGTEENGRVLVRVRGDLKVRAWMPTSRLATRVQRKGKLGGTEVYVGPGDFVRVLGPSDRPGIVRVEARVRLGLTQQSAAIEGLYPADRLAPTPPPENAEAPTAGQWHRSAANAPLSLHVQPGGTIAAELPASLDGYPVEVISTAGEWRAVRVGLGPYYLGYVRAELTPMDAPQRSEALLTEGVPTSLLADADKPLVQLPAGTRIGWSGSTIAIAGQQVAARLIERFESDGEADVYASDGYSSIRGIVPLTAIQP